MRVFVGKCSEWAAGGSALLALVCARLEQNSTILRYTASGVPYLATAPLPPAAPLTFLPPHSGRICAGCNPRCQFFAGASVPGRAEVSLQTGFLCLYFVAWSGAACSGPWVGQARRRPPGCPGLTLHSTVSSLPYQQPPGSTHFFCPV